MDFKKFLLLAILAITINIQLGAMEAMNETSYQVMDINDYKRECLYLNVFIYFSKNLHPDVCKYIISLLAPKLPLIRAEFLNDLKPYLSKAQDIICSNARDLRYISDEFFPSLKSLEKTCTLETLSHIVIYCLAEEKWQFKSLSITPCVQNYETNANHAKIILSLAKQADQLITLGYTYKKSNAVTICIESTLHKATADISIAICLYINKKDFEIANNKLNLFDPEEKKEIWRNLKNYKCIIQ